MKYQAIEDNLFFQHAIAMTCNTNRIKELDKHLQTYGRRSIDWEIRSQTRKDSKSTKFYKDWYSLIHPTKDNEVVFFKKKTDAVKFKLSWNECQSVDPYDFWNSSFSTTTSKIGRLYTWNISSFYGKPLQPYWSTYYEFDKQGQYLLDLDGSIAARKNRRATLSDDIVILDDYIDVSKFRTIASNFSQPKGRDTGTKNLCAEVDLGEGGDLS